MVFSLLKCNTAAQNRVGGQSVAVYARGWYWGQSCSMFSLTIWTMGKSTSWACSQMIQNWEEWLIYQMVVPPFRGTLTSWRTGSREISCSSARGNAKSCTWGGIISGTSTCQWSTVWKAALCRRTLGSRWTKIWPWSSNVFLQQRSQTASKAELGKLWPASQRRWFPLLTDGTHLEYCAQFWVSQSNKYMEYWSKSRADPQKIKWLEHLMRIARALPPGEDNAQGGSY